MQPSRDESSTPGMNLPSFQKKRANIASAPNRGIWINSTLCDLYYHFLRRKTSYGVKTPFHTSIACREILIWDAIKSRVSKSFLISFFSARVNLNPLMLTLIQPDRFLLSCPVVHSLPFPTFPLHDLPYPRFLISQSTYLPICPPIRLQTFPPIFPLLCLADHAQL